MKNRACKKKESKFPKFLNLELMEHETGRKKQVCQQTYQNSCFSSFLTIFLSYSSFLGVQCTALYS